MSAKLIKIKKEGYTSYLVNDTLLLLKKSGYVYGFEKEAAALVLQIEELIEKKDDIFQYFPFTFYAHIKRIKEILTEEGPVETYEHPLELGNFVKKKGFCCSIVDESFGFCIDSNDSDWIRRCRNIVDLFQKDGSAKSISVRRMINISFKEVAKHQWQLFFNDIPVGLVSSEETIPLLLQENLIIAYYQSSSYLMALHAGAIEIGGKVFLLPGISGSGKSTLTVALAYDGHGLFSDEIGLIGDDGKMRKLPFAMNVKEGSWNILRETVEEFDSLDIHKRFDGQRVKLVPPVNLVSHEQFVDYIVFPKFIKGSQTKLTRLSICETLQRIKEAGYQLHHPLTEDDFGRILQFILTKPAYSMIFGSLEEGKKCLKAIANE